MKFSKYFNLWLYEDDGYYAKAPKIGKEGDFYTSVSTSMFFGGTIGKRVVDLISNKELSTHATIVEIGAHQGYMLADLIQFIYTLNPSFLKHLHFSIVEPMKHLQNIQKKYFKKAFGDEISFSIVSKIEELNCDEAVVINNELLDAFPCEIIHEEKMLHVKNHIPYFDKMSAEVRDISNKLGVKKGEISIGYEEFFNKLKNSFKNIHFIGFDYGQMESREDFSIRVYKDHQTYPLFSLTNLAGNSERFEEFFKKSDLTYDVNFNHVKSAMLESGFKEIEFKSQMSALVDFGINELLDLFRQNVDEKVYKNELEKVKRLILPTYFGERFKMVSSWKRS